MSASADRVVRIAGASACEFDSSIAIPQLLRHGGPIDYMIFDELAELNVASMVGSGKSVIGLTGEEQQGFARSFVDIQVGPHLEELMARGIKLLANAGGPNPRACAAALAVYARSVGLAPKIAFVEGDNLIGRQVEFTAMDLHELATDGTLGEIAGSADRVLTLLAYTGAAPIVEALARGADIVIAGRAADSATALAALMHEFGWSLEDFDLLAAGSVIGHLLECGAQATGGIFTDWRDASDWSYPTYPVAECRADGTAVIVAPEGTGGLATVGTVAEQLFYEVSDPQEYILPDVVCDLSEVRLTQQAGNRVLVEGVRGRGRTSSYKLQMTYERGWRGAVMSPILGVDAAAKGDRLAAALFAHIERLLDENGLGEPEATLTQILGTGESLGAHHDAERRGELREVIVRMTMDHPRQEGAELFLREQVIANIGLSPGVAMPLGHTVHPILRMRAFLIDKSLVELTLTVGDEQVAVPVPTDGTWSPALTRRHEEPVPPAGEVADAVVSLIDLAWGRSGDKGNTATVGIIAREREFIPWIGQALSADAVADWLAHQFEGPGPRRVDRVYSPGTGAFSLLLHAALGGGALESRRLDPMGKTVAQQLLAIPVPVPAALATRLGGRHAAPQHTTHAVAATPAATR